MNKVFEHSTADLLRVRQPVNLTELLSGFREEIFRDADVDGCELNLLDDSAGALVTALLCLPDEFAGIQSTYLGFQYHLNVPDANAQVYASGLPRLISESELDRFDETTRMRFERWKMRSLVVLPVACQLQDGSMHTVGTVAVFSQHAQFDADALDRLEAVVDLYAPQILIHWQCHQAVERRKMADVMLTEIQQFVRDITRMNSLTAVEEVFSSISGEFIDRFGVDMVSILLEENGELPIVHTAFSEPFRNLAEPWEAFRSRTRYSLSVRDGQSPMVYQKNQLFQVRDVQTILHLPMAEKDKEGLAVLGTPRTFMIVPIRLDTEVIGVLWLISLARPVEFPATDLSLIELLASFVSTAIRNAKAHMTVARQKAEIEALNSELKNRVVQLDQVSRQDRLTGLNNFGSFEEEIRRRVGQYDQHGSGAPLSIILLDIDHFKPFNDTYGHPAGNQVLREVGVRIMASVREMDFVARFGGEEFVVLLPQCAIEDAEVIAERIRAALEDQSIAVDDAQHRITISAGCAQFVPGESVEQFISRADQALYAAKRNGRNRIERAA